MQTAHTVTKEGFSQSQILEWLQEVKDPEIPTVSLVDLGVIDSVRITDDGQVHVSLTPTFTGCPAIGFMQLNARECLIAHGVQEPIVEINHQKLWSSNNITERGRKHLLDFGLSPPPKYIQEVTEEVLEAALCPKCGSQNTQLKNPFGPTLCRAIHYCNNCFETFEQFKPL